MKNNTTNTMSNNFFIVLRDNNNTLVSWRAYNTIDEAILAFAFTINKIKECTAGDFSAVHVPGKPKTIVGSVYADSQGNTITLERSNNDQLRHIVLDTLPTVRDMFEHCLDV